MNDQSPFSESLEVKKLGELIKNIKIAMLTTVREDQSLHSSPLLTQETDFDGSLWFLISRNSQKCADLRKNPHVCISYASGSRYISVSGVAEFENDLVKVQQLWHRSYQSWFPQGILDPTIQILKVKVEKAEFWEGHSLPVTSLLEFMSIATGGHIKTGDHGELNLKH